MPGNSSNHKISILLAEDNEMNRLLVTIVLKRFGFEVEAVSSGKQAIDLLEKGRLFDCILMDIQMPEMDGYEACAVIRNRLRNPVPVIALSAQSPQGQTEKCLAAGMNDFIVKPFEPDMLLDKIMHHISSVKKKTVKSKQPGRDTPGANGSYVNLAYLDEITQGNAEHKRELVKAFIETMPRMLSMLSDHCTNKQYDEMRMLAHRMKSGAGALLRPEALSLLDEIEYSETGKESAHDINAKVKRFSALCEMALQELKRIKI